jgi:hypothetical protein
MQEKKNCRTLKCFWADLRIIGERKQNPGSEENIFGHFIIFRGPKKEYPES